MANDTQSNLRNEISDRLSPSALAYWNGCDRQTMDDFTDLAQREGIASAVAEVEDCAKPENEIMTSQTETETVYVVRDAAGEYVSAKGRTPASDEAREFETREEAEAACYRETDRVLTREV